jgi:hypothetical protein
MKKPIKQNGRKRINNAGYKQYSHSYANDNYSKKRPENLRELIVNSLVEQYNSAIDYYEQRITSAEQIAMKLEVLHKFVFQEFHKMQKEGLLRLCRDDNSFAKKKTTVFNGKTEYLSQKEIH